MISSQYWGAKNAPIVEAITQIAPIARQAMKNSRTTLNQLISSLMLGLTTLLSS